MSERGHCLYSDMHQLTRAFISAWQKFLANDITSSQLLIELNSWILELNPPYCWLQWKKRILAPNSSVLSSWVIDDFWQIWIFILKRRKGLWQHWEFLRFILRHFTRAQIFHLPVGCSSPTPHSKPSVEKLLCHTNNVLNLNTKCNA